MNCTRLYEHGVKLINHISSYNLNLKKNKNHDKLIHLKGMLTVVFSFSFLLSWQAHRYNFKLAIDCDLTGSRRDKEGVAE